MVSYDIPNISTTTDYNYHQLPYANDLTSRVMRTLHEVGNHVLHANNQEKLKFLIAMEEIGGQFGITPKDLAFSERVSTKGRNRTTKRLPTSVELQEKINADREKAEKKARAAREREERAIERQRIAEEKARRKQQLEEEKKEKKRVAEEEKARRKEALEEERKLKEALKQAKKQLQEAKKEKKKADSKATTPKRRSRIIQDEEEDEVDCENSENEADSSVSKTVVTSRLRKRC